MTFWGGLSFNKISKHLVDSVVCSGENKAGTEGSGHALEKVLRKALQNSSAERTIPHPKFKSKGARPVLPGRPALQDPSARALRGGLDALRPPAGDRDLAEAEPRPASARGRCPTGGRVRRGPAP